MVTIPVQQPGTAVAPCIIAPLAAKAPFHGYDIAAEPKHPSFRTSRDPQDLDANTGASYGK